MTNNQMFPTLLLYKKITKTSVFKDDGIDKTMEIIKEEEKKE